MVQAADWKLLRIFCIIGGGLMLLEMLFIAGV